MKRLLAMLLALLLLCGAALAEGEFPELNEKGFLDEGEFLYENPDDGVWRYASQTLKVEIIRYTQKSPKRIWYEAEVWTDGSDVFHMIPHDPENRMKGDEWPYMIARNNDVVLAINSDYAQTRINQRQTVGIIIRDGEILQSKTKTKNAKGFPNLDTLALFPNGDMQVFWSDEKKPAEYLEMGATDVLAFGPWLIRDGELNEKGLKKYGTSAAQRTAIGMVEKGHYFAMMLEGRLPDAKGAGVSFLAEKLLERGCQVGFNLDGGQTSSMVFMGRQICDISTKKSNVSSRKTAEILGIGHSELVRTMEDPW